MAKKRANAFSNGRRFKKYAECGSMVAQDAAKALAMVRKLKTLINVEYKTLTTTLGDSTPVNVAAIGNLTNITVGDDLSNRDGRKIKAFSIQLKGIVIMNESATTTITRLLLFIDHANTGTPPTRAQLFASEAAFFNGQVKISDPQSNSRFKVLWDKIIVHSDSGTKMSKINFYKKLNHHITFTGTAGDDEGIGTLWIMTSSNQPTNTPNLIVDAVFKWIDN